MKEDSSFRTFFLFWFTYSHVAVFNEGACSGDALHELGYEQVLLIPTDKQSGIELLHAYVDVVLIAAKQVDPKDVTGH